MKTIPLFSLMIAVLLLFIIACNKDEAPDIPDEPDVPNYNLTKMESTPQRDGDEILGYDYLVNGSYVSSGFPLQTYRSVFGQDPSNPLNRTGENATLNYQFTAVTATNGVTVVAANCLQCHAQSLNGELIVGLGNSVGDFTNDQSVLIPFADQSIINQFGNPSPEWTAYEPFRTAILAIGPHLVQSTIGANPADNLAFVLGAHRNPIDLSWLPSPVWNFPSIVVPVDVPAWWLMKKKNQLYQTGVGVGDFAKLSMASGLLTLQDSAEARIIDANFADVIAYIESIEPPVYPEVIDENLAAEGKAIFDDKCAICHGTYGNVETYPNFLVDLETIGTDDLLVNSNFSDNTFATWYNNSWFAESPNAANFNITNGYVAPPLDGIWATAPYLHNGSVPTIYGVLNSTERPAIWKRTFNTSDYDYAKLGWNHTIESTKADENTYDTNEVGYGNKGHIFGDDLLEIERLAVIEYLKKL